MEEVFVFYFFILIIHSYGYAFIKSLSWDLMEFLKSHVGAKTARAECGRGSGRPRRMSLKNTLFRQNDGGTALKSDNSRTSEQEFP